ncbi:MAG: hypothetical protein K2R98_03445 [Gemmataceae bacterium]|nr:hypothetical protein [Gemmataceae bacterium]
MPRLAGHSRWRAMLIMVGFCALPATFGLSADTSDSDEAPPEPVAVRRVLLLPDRLAAELERAKRGVLVQLSRDDFEKQMKSAAQAGEALKQPPRLIEARYRASLADTSLVGTGEWKIANPGPTAAILGIHPLGLALRHARWPDNKEAILGELDGKELSLLVDNGGERSLLLDWSARSNPVPGGLRFSLDVPPCAVATLELELPADRAVTVSRDAYLLSGPHPAAAADRCTWRISFAGRSQVNFVVRRAKGPNLPTPLVLSRLQTKQELTPGQLQAEFDFDVEVLHGAVSELRCECGPGLRPYDVTIRNLESWELRAGAPTAPSTLIIRLREPFQGGSLQVRCLAPLATDKVWTSPGVRLLNSVSRGESLVLRVHPEFQLEDWKSAGFRLTRTAFQQDNWHVLTLGAGLDAGAIPERPLAQLRMPGSEFKARQFTWWQVAPDRVGLTTQIVYEVARGRLFRLPVLLPPGYEIEHVELSPPELLRYWTVSPDKVRPTLTVDLDRALDPTTSARLNVRARLTQVRAVPTAGLSLPVPDLVPMDARLREGALAISVAPLYQATPSASVPAAPVETAVNADGGTRPGTLPWGKQALDFYFPFRGQPVEGTLQLRPRPTQFRARISADVILASGKARERVRLELTPEVGTPTTINLFAAGPAVGSWEWRTVRGSNSVKRVDRLVAYNLAPSLSALSARGPLQLLGAAALTPPRGTWWRLVLDRPLTEPLSLESAVELPGQAVTADPTSIVLPLAGSHPLAAIALTTVAVQRQLPSTGDRRWEVPLIIVPGAERLDGRVTLHLAGADLVQIETQGLQEVSETAKKAEIESPSDLSFVVSSSSSWRTFRYGHPPLGLVLRGQTPAADRSAEAVVDRAWLTTYLRPDDSLLHHYRFQIWNWRQQTVPLRLPGGVQLTAVKCDGRWIGRLPLEPNADGTVTVQLPVVGDSTVHRYEVAYTTETPTWSVWSRLESPAPAPTVRVLAFRRTWSLPADVTPVASKSLRRLPGAAAVEPFPLPSFFEDRTQEEESARQQQLVTDALARLRKQLGTDEPGQLGPWLEMLAFDCMKDQAPLVVDVRAVRQAGATLSSRVRFVPDGNSALPFWETAGLVVVPCRSAPLLTSRQQLAAWQMTAGDRRPVGAGIETAVAEAAGFGHDSSGRFRTVADWLRGRTNEQNTADPLTPSVVPASLGSETVEWECLAGPDYTDSVLVVRQSAVPLLGVSVAGTLLLFAWILWKRLSERRGRRLLLTWLALSGLALLWLPTPLRALALWPALVGVAAAALWCVQVAFHRPAPQVVLTAPIVGSLLALLALAGTPGQAAAPAPTTIYLVPGSDNEKPTVLAPPELLEQLQALARRGVAGLRGAFLQSAVYEGKADHQNAQFEARFQVHCFSEEASTLLLPLGGVQLTEALLDGAATHPVAVRPPREGYSIEVKGRGSHSVLVRFSVPLAATGDDRDVRFTIPELPRNRLLLDVPPGAGYLQVAEVRGAQRVISDDKTARLEADLGAVGTVRVRWRRDASRPNPAVVTVRESYYWDLHASSARLLALLRYDVEKGWATSLAIDLPKDMEVLSAEAGPVPGSTSAPRLKEWVLRDEGAGRRLQLDFQGPVTGSVLVSLEMVPRQSFGKAVSLPFPTPLDPPPREDGQPVRAFVAYRAEGIEAAYEGSKGITGIERNLVADTFAQAFQQPWRTARQEDLSPPNWAYWRNRGGVLLLKIQPPGSQVRSQQDVSWRVDARQAVLQAAARLTAPDSGLSLLEWTIPANVVVTEVSGPHLRSWSRTGSRVQVWLQRPVGETTLQLTGWVPRDPARLDLPCLRMAAKSHGTLLRVTAGDGVAVTPTNLSALTPRPDQTVAGREWVYTSDQESYGASFQTRAAGTTTDCRLLTFAEVRNRQLSFVTTVECQVNSGELRHLTIAVRNWEGGDVQLDAGSVIRRREHRVGSSGRAWVLELQPGVTKRYQLTLSSTLPLGSSPEIYLPDVRVENVGGAAVRMDRWLAVAGPELAAEAISGLMTASNAPDAIRAWPRDAERLRRAGGAAWHVLSDDWRLRLRPRSAATRPSPVQVLLTEHAMAVADGRRWIHQATYWLYHEAGTDLSVTLPTGASVLAVAIDGVGVPPLEPGTERLWLPLSGGAGGRAIRLTWAFAEGREPVFAPILGGPRLEGVAEGPVVWTVQVPPGYQLGRGARNDPDTSSAAGMDLWRAAAQLRLAIKLIERSREEGEPLPLAQLNGVRDRFDRLCRQAEYRLGLPGPTQRGTGPEGQSLTAWLPGLRSEYNALEQTNLIERPSGSEARPAGRAESGSLSPFPFVLSPFERGQPAHWQSADGGAAPKLTLIGIETSQTRHTLGLSAVFLVLLLAVWILSHFFRAAAWPEQVALLGCLGSLLFGSILGTAFLLLPIIAVVARLVCLGQWIHAWWKTRPALPVAVAVEGSRANDE